MKNEEFKYMQIYRHIREGIREGAWPCGSRLPSKRSLAAEHGMSILTVQHAYELLCSEGYAESRERSGYYVTYRSGDLYGQPGDEKSRSYVSKEGTESPSAADESSSDRSSPLFPSSVLLSAMRGVIADHGEHLLLKSPNSGLPELRNALSAYLIRSRGIRVAADQIVIGSGAEYLYGAVVQLFGRDRLYALEDPSYEKIRRVYAANGAKTELLAMGSDGILSSALDESRASVLHVTPYNSYPSQVTASASKRTEYIRWAASRGGYIVEDDYDSEFTLLSKPEDTLFSLEPTHSVLYLNTFSRTVAPSLRVGYLVLPPDLVPVYRERLGFVSCTVPVFEQYLLAELIDSGKFEQHINRIRRQRRKA